MSNEIVERDLNKRLTRAVSIRRYCKETCCCGDLKSWKECTACGCFLWPYRLGYEVGTDGERTKKNSTVSQRVLENLAKARQVQAEKKGK